MLVPMANKLLPRTFRHKKVLNLDCGYCGLRICDRGMRAILLADTKIELYSTDQEPKSTVEAINDAYMTTKCKCKVRDIACLSCGNVVGYTVCQPCPACLTSCHNGHLWMFHSSVVVHWDRYSLKEDNEIMTWFELLSSDYLTERNNYIDVPRR